VNNPVTISTGGAVVISDQNVIIQGIVPIYISLSSNFTSYYIFNSTSSPVPFINGFSYTDINGVFQFVIPPMTHLQLAQNQDGTWTQFTDTATIPLPPRPYMLPVARTGVLGGVKGGGANIVIANDGTISAVNGAQVQSDWDEADNTQPDFIKNKPSIPPPYSLPPATSSVRGGIRVGSGLVITGDVLSAPGSAGGITQLTGDGAAGPGSGSQALALATVNINIGTFGDATHVPKVTVNAKGLITAVSSVAITGGGGGITQLTGDINAGPGSGTQAATLASIISAGTSGDSTHVPQITYDVKGRITAVTLIAIAGIAPTCMPLASQVGVLANGTDQTANLITALSNANYSGIIFDYSPAAIVVINGSVNCGAKTLRFAPGNYISGTYTIINFILDCGLKQKCFDIGTSGVPSGIINPIGTSLSVISPWVFGANDGGGDVVRYFQATSDCCIRNGAKLTRIYIPTGTYTLNSPWIIYDYNTGGGTYVFHYLMIEGENSFSSADGFSTALNFGGRNNSFGIGIHQGKGTIIKNIKLIGAFNYTFPGAYIFYSSAFTSMTDGSSRDSIYSPNSAIVIDPFGPSVPPDGGWPGNDAYGTALSAYYKGNTNGSTGVTIEQVFISKWVIGVITSPNGQTANAELLLCQDIQIQNIKIGFASCQSQEKLNIIRRVESWGVCGCVFATNLYGAESPGSWQVEDVNIAGFSNVFIYNIQTGYFPSFFSNIYAESLGSFGTLSGSNGTLVSNGTINFVDYNEGGSYLPGQITGQGMTFHGFQLRMYGTNKPITINATNGPMYFRDCAFEIVPFYNQDYSTGYCAFNNCTVENPANQLGAMDFQSCSAGALSNTFAYGNIKINMTSKVLNVLSGFAGIRMPINRTTSNYLVTITFSTYHQAVITCSSDELNRVFVGDVICGETGGSGTNIQILGIVTAAGGGQFTISNIPATIVSGSHYYLYLWAPLRNIAFIADQTSGSNLLTNVTIIAGDIANFVPGGAYGGWMKSKTLQQTDAWNSNMFRMLVWNGSNQITIDRNSTANLTQYLFTNMDAFFEPGTPTAVVGAAAGGSGAAVSRTKGTDKSMQISFTQGASPITGILATVTLSIPFAAGYIPSVKFSPANAAAAAISGATQVWMDAATPSTFTINTGSGALNNGTTYVWNIEVN
jgi:hypothetical protein